MKDEIMIYVKSGKEETTGIKYFKDPVIEHICRKDIPVLLEYTRIEGIVDFYCRGKKPEKETIQFQMEEKKDDWFPDPRWPPGGPGGAMVFDDEPMIPVAKPLRPDNGLISIMDR